LTTLLTPALIPDTPRNRVASDLVRRACELIRAQASEPIRIVDIAEMLGVSVRHLQAGFRRHLDTTPHRFLRECRLELANTKLISALPGDTVTRIALDCGLLISATSPVYISALWREAVANVPPNAAEHVTCCGWHRTPQSTQISRVCLVHGRFGARVICQSQQHGLQDLAASRFSPDDIAAMSASSRKCDEWLCTIRSLRHPSAPARAKTSPQGTGALRASPKL
jgi:AraC-like DNA-binding protein